MSSCCPRVSRKASTFRGYRVLGNNLAASNQNHLTTARRSLVSGDLDIKVF